jgi:hypothetical protein
MHLEGIAGVAESVLWGAGIRFMGCVEVCLGRGRVEANLLVVIVAERYSLGGRTGG